MVLLKRHQWHLCVLISITLMLFVTNSYGQEIYGPNHRDKDSLSIYFSQNKAVLELYVPGNRAAFSKLDSLLGREDSGIRLDSIVITATASPDGSPELNRRLSGNRASALITHIRTSYPHIPLSSISTNIRGADWEGLLALVQQDADVPAREHLIALINSSFPDAEKERLMRTINSGKTFAYVRQHFLPRLRRGMVCVLYYTFTKEEEPVNVAPEEPPRQTDKSGLSETVSRQEETVAPITEIPVKHRKPFPPFALKTNLLFDAASVLNVEVEIPIGPRWSINAEYMFPWWQWRTRHYTIQTLSGNVEGRYWLGDRSRKGLLEGFFVGAYTGGGYYDLQLGNKGWQGEFYIALGASAGYAHRIGKRLGMEYSIGLGYMHTKYREYLPMDDCKVWQKDGRWSYLGPTKIKVSLVWMLGDKGRWQR